MATSTGRGDWPLLSVWWSPPPDAAETVILSAVPYRTTRDLDGAAKAVWHDFFFEAAGAPPVGQPFMLVIG